MLTNDQPDTTIANQADTQPSAAPSSGRGRAVKAVLIRFPEQLHSEVAAAATALSKTRGGAYVSFTAAALHLIQGGLQGHDSAN